MDFLADIFLAAAALSAMVFCFVLSRKLGKFNDLEKGVGGAVAMLAVQVDDLNKTIETAQEEASKSAEILRELTEKAERSSKQLQMQFASLHDLPQQEAEAQKTEPPKAPPTLEEVATVFVRHRDVVSGTADV